MVIVSGTEAPTSVVDGIDEDTGTIEWSQGSSAEGTAAAGGGLVYMSQFIGTILWAYDVETGDIVWLATLGGELGDVASPAFADNHVFAGANNYLFALNASRGGVNWKDNDRYFPSSTPAVGGGVGYFTAGPRMFAFDPSTGALLWHTKADFTFGSSPAVANEVLYVGVGDVLRAYDASSGQGVWDSPVAGGLFSSSPAVSDGVVYASTDDGTVYAFALP